ncbi:MAG: hypothetical protein FJ363_08910 [Gemmatimonadetes bacterium]|nr:hypothetical protein [Gemmatimonadota bacterium]
MKVPRVRARAMACALLLTVPTLGVHALPAQGIPQRDAEGSAAGNEGASRRWPRRLVMPVVMGAAAALAASAYFISNADDPVGSCTGPRCVLPLSVGIGMGVGYLMGREMDNAHALRYRRGAPVRAEGQALTLQGEPQWMSVGARQGAAGGGAGGVQLFSTDGAPKLLARRASGIRGVRGLDLGPGGVAVAATTGLYEFAVDSALGLRVRDGDIAATAVLAERRVVGIGDRLEVAPRSGTSDTTWRSMRTGGAVRAMTVDPTGRLLWVATDSALASYILDGDSLVRRASARLAGGVRTVRTDGPRVVVAAGERGIWLFDSDDRGTPRERFLWAGARFAYDALITRERVYVAGGGEGLYVLDARAARGTVLGLARQVGFAVALGEEGGYTYVLDRAAPAVHRLRSDFPLR